MGGFVIRGVLCYMDVQLLLGCETEVVGFRRLRNCFLKVGGRLSVWFGIGLESG